MTRNAKNRLLPLVVAVAGATLSGLQNFRFQSPSFFPFTLPPNNILKSAEGRRGLFGQRWLLDDAQASIDSGPLEAPFYLIFRNSNPATLSYGN